MRRPPMTDPVPPLILQIHAFSGIVALIVAPLAMLARKGGDWHRHWGKVFFYGMAVVALTSIIAGFMRPNILMALVAVFSYHMVASGYRSLYMKRLHEGQKPARMDIILHATAGMVNGGLLLWGVVNLALGNRGSGPIIFMVFGLVGLFVVFRNVHGFYKRQHDKHEWLYGHMTGFLGGYIATLSAFSAVNLNFIKPMWLQWLWPTMIGVPFIVLWVRYYQRRFTRGRRAKDVFPLKLR